MTAKPVLPAKLKAAAALYALLPLEAVVHASIDPDHRFTAAPLYVFLALAPVVAVGLTRIRRIALVAFFIHAPWVICLAALTAGFASHKWPAILAMVHAALCGLPFLSSDARRPYMLQDGSGFRRHRRYATQLACHVDVEQTKHPGTVVDLSFSGAFVEIDPAPFRLNQSVFIDIRMREGSGLRCPTTIASIQAEAVATKARGIAVEFSSLTANDIATIEKFFSLARRHPRIPVQLPVTFVRQNQTVRAGTFDVSMSGCYVCDNAAASMHAGDKVQVTLHLYEGDELETVAEVVWLTPEERHGKPPGFGVEFRHLTRDDKKRLADRIDQRM